MPESHSEIPLADAVFRAKLSWHQGYRLLLSGKLRGRRIGTRWFVEAASLDQFVRERESVDAPPPAA